MAELDVVDNPAACARHPGTDPAVAWGCAECGREMAAWRNRLVAKARSLLGRTAIRAATARERQIEAAMSTATGLLRWIVEAGEMPIPEAVAAAESAGNGGWRKCSDHADAGRAQACADCVRELRLWRREVCNVAARLEDGAKSLPCPVAAMTEREREIFESLSPQHGLMLYLAGADAAGLPEETENTLVDRRIAAASFDPGSWELALTTKEGVEVLDLTKYGGFGMDGNALRSPMVCECGQSVWFPHFPPPGAVIAFETDSQGR
jgi:hypothetical protein